MARNMTTVQKGNTIRFGSAKFEVGKDVDNLVDLGAMRNIEFEEVWEERRFTGVDGTTYISIEKQQAFIRGDLMEISLENLALLRGGLDQIEGVKKDGDQKGTISLYSGNRGEILQPRVVKITNYNDKNEAFSITLFKATISRGITLAFPSSDDGDSATIPIELNGTLDVSRDYNQQLFAIEDEQSY